MQPVPCIRCGRTANFVENGGKRRFFCDTECRRLCDAVIGADIAASTRDERKSAISECRKTVASALDRLEAQVGAADATAPLADALGALQACAVKLRTGFAGVPEVQVLYGGTGAKHAKTMHIAKALAEIAPASAPFKLRDTTADEARPAALILVVFTKNAYQDYTELGQAWTANSARVRLGANQKYAFIYIESDVGTGAADKIGRFGEDALLKLRLAGETPSSWSDQITVTGNPKLVEANKRAFAAYSEQLATLL